MYYNNVKVKQLEKHTVHSKISVWLIFEEPVIFFIEFLTAYIQIILDIDAMALANTILAALAFEFICAICKHFCHSLTFLCTF